MSLTIRLVDVVKTYLDRNVLDGINLTIEGGKITVILGGSGEGKSTLLKLMVGALKPDAGEVWIEDQNIVQMSADRLEQMRCQMGMLFQNAALIRAMTVGENVALPIEENTDLDPNIVEIMVRMKLEQVGLSDFEDFFPDQLSGGMQKRVGLARAIALDPKVVFYDEPSAGLDPVAAAVIDKLIVDLNQVLGITSVVVTHNINSAFKIAHKIALIYQGRIVAEGSPLEIRHSPDELVQQFINGVPDGPIQLRHSKEEYLRSLLHTES